MMYPAKVFFFPVGKPKSIFFFRMRECKNVKGQIRGVHFYLSGVKNSYPFRVIVMLNKSIITFYEFKE